jgi:hypothetical protein
MYTVYSEPKSGSHIGICVVDAPLPRSVIAAAISVADVMMPPPPPPPLLLCRPPPPLLRGSCLCLCGRRWHLSQSQPTSCSTLCLSQTHATPAQPPPPPPPHLQPQLTYPAALKCAMRLAVSHATAILLLLCPQKLQAYLLPPALQPLFQMAAAGYP